MIIADLPYSEPISCDNISGGDAVLSVGAVAFVLGNSAHTVSMTDTFLKTVGKKGKVTIGRGKGFAFASGDVCYADTAYLAEGFDKVIVNERGRNGEKFCFERVRIIALDLPH